MNFSDNEYTTAPGDNSNTGTSPASPLASLSVLLRNYRLGVGDIVFVDSGTYSVSENIVLGPEHSGLRIQGPTGSANAAVLDRANLQSNGILFHLRDSASVTIDSLELVGANEAFRVEGASHDATLSNSVVRNGITAIHSLPTANRVVISNNEIHSHSVSSTVVDTLIFEGGQPRIEGNVIRNNAGNAIKLNFSAPNAVIRGNDIFGNARQAIIASSTAALIEQQNPCE